MWCIWWTLSVGVEPGFAVGDRRERVQQVAGGPRQ
jgi:hypothetical protein